MKKFEDFLKKKNVLESQLIIIRKRFVESVVQFSAHYSSYKNLPILENQLFVTSVALKSSGNCLKLLAEFVGAKALLIYRNPHFRKRVKAAIVSSKTEKFENNLHSELLKR